MRGGGTRNAGAGPEHHVTNTNSGAPLPSRRGLARRLTVQALYQWLVNETAPDTLIRQFHEQPEGLGRADGDYFAELLKGVVEEAPALTVCISPHLDRPVAQLDPVEHGILLLAAFELQKHPEVPWKVVVNEAVNLAKTFGAEEGYKFVNGVLDKLARDLRPSEI
jgi:N utilization substance protein B